MYQYRDCRKCVKNLENWICPMMMEEDDDRDLDAMYPKLYYAVLPMVQKHCDRMEEKHGEMHTPAREELDEILDNILSEVEHDIDNMVRNDVDEDLLRQIPERRVLRDLLGIVFIDELGRRRRRRPRRRRPRRPYPFPPGRPGYYPGYPGYPYWEYDDFDDFAD